MKKRMTAAVLALALVCALTSCGMRDGNGNSNNGGGSANNGTSANGGTGSNANGSASAGQVRRYNGRSAAGENNVEMSGVPDANPQRPRTTNPYIIDGRYRAGSDGQVRGDGNSVGRDLTRDARDMIRDAGDVLGDMGKDAKNAVRDMTGTDY